MHWYRYMRSVRMFENEMAAALPNGNKTMPLEDWQELIRGNGGQLWAHAGMRTLAADISL